MMLRYAIYTFAAIVLLHTLWPMKAHAQSATPVPRVSQCQAIAGALPSATFASFTPPIFPAQAAGEEVSITYVGHSTFLIETPGGIAIATDYSGWYKPPRLPTVVTMNKAHSSHFTLTPDPAIKHVLHGWSDDGKPADHDLVVGDVSIRNVTTDIRSGYGAMEPNGNSIFIFEVAGLCIGHLGHLHHELDDSHYAEIGRLDVVMVPVDGGLTMGAESMSRVVSRLRSALILPMHRRGPPIDNFLSMFDEKFDRSFAESDNVIVSLRSLPGKPLIYILKGV
ncbi:L-ascorbate metabolism protein UlaG (beta-lactamase superfamily) [Pararhizobium capsulatum DSM 1112]|uniref:L-ascorbate metabolism protein UlaG (Beta-lactamase superfamily) n=1 Tax=Pararhizobium capsulatum DSM 1112 TaxID=1121113 RepID=A0ABU0BUX3_9HYPH|nr:MBL fold metallo-hydrolase [Pararhizobium capsulatum]MDQ0321782.1 L-ascorbate metabolism protein UlaG (beta-lactamase superfamily) [Pararhizobium capsulatum DSM 1112]